MAKARPKKPPRRPTFFREWRQKHGLTQEQAADRLGLTQPHLSKIERGKSHYGQEFLENAAIAYDCEPADLLIRNPLQPDAVWSILDNLRKASPDQRDQFARVADALLKRAG